MKFKNQVNAAFTDNFDDKIKKGSIAIIDSVKYDPGYNGNVAVRVINIDKRPRCLSIKWFEK